MVTAKRNRQRHREFSREIVRRLGGRYVGGIEGQDIECGPFSIEIKTVARFIGETALAQAEKNCPEGKSPIAIIHQTRKRISKAIVLMRLDEFEEWHVPAVRL